MTVDSCSSRTHNVCQPPLHLHLRLPARVCLPALLPGAGTALEKKRKAEEEAAAGPWTKLDANEVFQGPGILNGMSRGIAAFYRVELKERHPSSGSKGHYIAKDLAHAVDEVGTRRVKCL